jgi:hypothetical protein
VILITRCKRSNTAILERDAPLGKWPGVRIDCRGGSAAAYKTAPRSLHMSASAGRKRGGIFNCRAVTREMEGGPPVNWTLGDRMAWVFLDHSKGGPCSRFPDNMPAADVAGR